MAPIKEFPRTARALLAVIKVKTEHILTLHYMVKFQTCFCAVIVVFLFDARSPDHSAVSLMNVFGTQARFDC